MQLYREGLTLICATLLSLCLVGQTDGYKPSDGIEVYGNIARTSGDKSTGAISGAEVRVVLNGDTLFKKANRRGDYSCILKYGHTYRIHFSSPDVCHKFVEIDTRNVPLDDRKKGYVMEIDMTLPQDASMQQIMILEEVPIGKAAYNKRADNFIFDYKYTKRVRGWMEREFEFSREKGEF